jgi:spore germination protein GerM
MNKRKLSIMILLGLLFIGGSFGGYLYFSRVSPKEIPAPEERVETLPKAEDLISLKIYHPVSNRLQIEEKRIQRRIDQMAIAQAVVEEFLKGPAGLQSSDIPKDAKLLGIYRDADRILYVDLSEEFKRNFQGDALSEFLLLKGLYDSLVSNLNDIEDVKILIEGSETETLGGHLYLSYPLKDMVSYETREIPSDSKEKENY